MPRRNIVLLSLVPVLMLSLWLARPASAAIAFRAAGIGNNGAGANTVTVAKPAGTAEKDVMIAVVSINQAGSTMLVGAPTGWTLVNENISTTVLYSATFYKVATASEPASYDFSLLSGMVPTSKKATGVIVGYSGVDTVNPIDAQGSQVNASSATMTAPSITTTAANAMLVAAYGTATGTTIAAGGSSMTLRGQDTSSGGGQAGTKATSAVQDVAQASPGATGTKTMTAGAAAVNIGHLIALKPAPAFSVSSYRVFNNADTSSSVEFTKLSNPATLPTGTSASSTAWSPDGTYMAVGHNNSPNVTIYKRSGDTFTKLTNPATLPTGAANSVAWSPDSVYLTVGHGTSPFVTIYKRSGDTFTKLANPATLPTGIGRGTAWSSDGVYMTVAHDTSPFVTIYKRSGDTFTKLANPATLPAGNGNGVAWSSDTTYMTVAHSTSPFVTIYKRSGDTFTKLANPATLPPTTAWGAAWSPDGNYMTVASGSSPYITIYQRSSDTFTKLSDPSTLPAGSGNGTAWSADGTYMSVAHGTSPFITIYKKRAEAQVSTPLANINTPAVSSGVDVPFRLRMGLHVTEGAASQGEALKLQYALRSGTCDINYTGETYGDVYANVGAVKFYNNANIVDADAVSSDANNPTHSTDPVVRQSYEEDNTFSVANAIPVGQDGLWDFSLAFDSSAAKDSYCFRVVKSDGTAIGNPSQVPEVSNPSPTVGQANYRFFANANSTTPGAPLAAQDTAATVAHSTPFRLRQRLAVDAASIPASHQNYKLQYAEKTAVCSSLTYSDYVNPVFSQTRYAGSALSDAGSGGTVPWTNVSNATGAPNSLYATAEQAFSTSTYFLQAYNYGFTIPAGTTIQGIEVAPLMGYNAGGADTAIEDQITLVDANSPVGNNASSSSNLGWVSPYGGPSDTWGYSWTPSSVNSSGFGFAVSAFFNTGGGNVIAEFDAAAITVYYSYPAGAISFYDNTSAADVAIVPSNANDPTNGARSTVYQRYRESDPFTNNSSIASGSDGLWDFALTSDPSAAGKTYCFKFVKSDGSPLDSYAQYPEITFSGGGGGGPVPTEQKLRGGRTLQNGVKSPFEL